MYFRFVTLSLFVFLLLTTHRFAAAQTADAEEEDDLYPGGCYNGPGVPLPPWINPETGELDCRDGFVCPHFNISNPETYPVYCPPSFKCMQDRATGNTCDRQGEFEPQLIPKGKYSDDRRTLKECPSGHFCVVGTTKPQKCPPMTACPAGSSKARQWGLVIWFLLIIVFLVGAVQFYRRKLAFSVLMHEAEDGQGFIISSAATTPRNSRDGSVDGGSENGSPRAASRSKKVQLLCDGFKRRRGAMKPLNFQFHNLRVSVPIEGGMKHLLNNVSGSFAPGKVTAIMGPSGSGKTTLMSTLLGKLPPQVTRAGHLHVNGENAVISKVRHLIGFVPQDDVLHTELSTYKNLYYSSEIRLPKEWTATERHLFRSAVVDIMGLTEARDVPIGDEFERGVSGGQRKRASIGLELVAAPLAMFLDEPTSGLDSFASMELCLLLREIALQTHLCVAMVIHQPRAEIWHTLDELLLLAPGGYTVYQGPQQEAQKYFEETCGVEFPLEMNPADAIMDAIAARADELVEQWALNTGDGVGSPDKASKVEVADDQGMEWLGASPLRQIVLSHNRALEKQLSIMQPFIIEIFVASLCGIILGQSMLDFEHASTYRDPYKQISIQPFDALLPQLNLYSLMSLSLAGATAGVRVLGEPMQNFYREAAAGHNRFAFFLGSIWAGLYRILISVYSFCAFYHVLPGLGFSFGEFYYTYLAGYFCMYALAAPVSVVTSKRNAPLIASLTGIVCSIFSGFVNYPQWMKHLSFGFYTAQSMHLAHDGVIKNAMDSSYSPWGYEDMHPGYGALINISWGVIVYAFGYILLTQVNKEKQR